MKKKIEDALHEAMRNKDEDRKRVLRMVLSSLKLAEVEKREELDESTILSILQKEVKMRQETIEEAKISGRSTIEAEQKKEIAILEEFLPKQVSEDELRAILIEIVNDTGAQSLKETGKVMSEAIPKIAGRATNSTISRIVKEILSKKNGG